MALTPSVMTPLGTPLPSFSLPDTTGAIVTPDDVADAPVLVVAVICNHCPYVVHIKEGLAQVSGRLLDAGAAFLAVNANDWTKYASDSPARMAEDVATFGYRFPYLADETQGFAKALGAACTPDFFVFDAERKLAYRGQFDDSRPGNAEPVTGADLERAVRALLDGGRPDADQVASIGCNVKWKPGMAPGGVGFLG